MRQKHWMRGILALCLFGLALGLSPAQGEEHHRYFRGTFIGAEDYGSLFLQATPSGEVEGTLASAKFDGKTTPLQGQYLPPATWAFATPDKALAFEGSLDAVGRLMGTWTLSGARGGSFTALEVSSRELTEPVPGKSIISQGLGAAFKGTYTGGKDYGTFRIVVGASGAITGMIVSARAENPLPLEVRGEAEGALGSFATLDGSHSFGGTFDEVGRFMGKWTFPQGEHGGSFTGLIQQ